MPDVADDFGVLPQALPAAAQAGAGGGVLQRRAVGGLAEQFERGEDGAQVGVLAGAAQVGREQLRVEVLRPEERAGDRRGVRLEDRRGLLVALPAEGGYAGLEDPRLLGGDPGAGMATCRSAKWRKASPVVISKKESPSRSSSCRKRITSSRGIISKPPSVMILMRSRKSVRWGEVYRPTRRPRAQSPDSICVSRTSARKAYSRPRPLVAPVMIATLFFFSSFGIRLRPLPGSRYQIISARIMTAPTRNVTITIFPIIRAIKAIRLSPLLRVCAKTATRIRCGKGNYYLFYHECQLQQNIFIPLSAFSL